MLTSNRGLGTGKKICTGDVEQFFLTETSIRCDRGLTLLANSNNGAPVYIGFSSDITIDDAFPISAGASLTITLDNPNGLYISGSSGNIVHWITM